MLVTSWQKARQTILNLKTRTAVKPPASTKKAKGKAVTPVVDDDDDEIQYLGKIDNRAWLSRLFLEVSLR
jgi:hypothetical protein